MEARSEIKKVSPIESILYMQVKLQTPCSHSPYIRTVLLTLYSFYSFMMHYCGMARECFIS